MFRIGFTMAVIVHLPVGFLASFLERRTNVERTVVIAVSGEQSYAGFESRRQWVLASRSCLVLRCLVRSLLEARPRQGRSDFATIIKTEVSIS